MDFFLKLRQYYVQNRRDTPTGYYFLTLIIIFLHFNDHRDLVITHFFLQFIFLVLGLFRFFFRDLEVD